VFALVVAVLNGVLFGMAPALRWTVATDATALGGRGAATARRNRLRSSLVLAEVAIAVVLVVVGGQLLDSFLRLLTTDPGFQAGRVLASVILPAPERYPTPARRAGFYRRILDSVRALPGVERAGTVDALPFSGENHGGSVHSRGSPDLKLTAEVDVIGGEYLQAMGVRLLQGRWFRDDEMAESNDAAIIDTSVASRLWPGRSPIGQEICVFCTPEHPDNWKRIVAVVSGMRHRALNEPIGGNVYLTAGAMQQAAFLVVRPAAGRGNFEKAIRDTVAGLDPNQPVFLSASMSALVADSVADQRFILWLLAVTAGLALVMSAAGIYGVIAFTTSRRTQEIGIRVAVGATSNDIQFLIFREGFATVAFGLAIGVSATIPLLSVLKGMLVGMESRHPASLSVAIGLVLVTAAFACWIPARRATAVDPVTALRQE
jgi:predicted permease